jgi:hypothetical protein
MRSETCVGRTVIATAMACVIAPAFIAGQAPMPQERVAALKASLQESQARLRNYEWIETTVISLKGEEKSRKQNRCYYGSDGKIQKVPLVDAAAPAQPAPHSQAGRGRRGARVKQHVVEHKKEEVSEYMQKAVALLHRYLPPDPSRIQASKQAGRASMLVVEPERRVRAEFGDYLQPGDALTIELNPATNHLLAARVSTYLEKPEDAVKLDVQFVDLPDGTSYQSAVTLDAVASHVRVVVQNTGHRPAASTNP